MSALYGISLSCFLNNADVKVQLDYFSRFRTSHNIIISYAQLYAVNSSSVLIIITLLGVMGYVYFNAFDRITLSFTYLVHIYPTAN